MATHSVYIFFWYMMAGVVVVLVGINSNLRGKEQFQERRIRV
jgi:hypothetical protein